MPAYDYVCKTCGRELELVHRISEQIERSAHRRLGDQSECDGTLERIVSLAGLSQTVGTRPPSDTQLERAGFTKYVRGTKGYEKAFGGSDTPAFVNRE